MPPQSATKDHNNLRMSQDNNCTTHADSDFSCRPSPPAYVSPRLISPALVSGGPNLAILCNSIAPPSECSTHFDKSDPEKPSNGDSSPFSPEKYQGARDHPTQAEPMPMSPQSIDLAPSKISYFLL